MSSTLWVLHAIKCLNDRGSWTGRVHIHKLLYITKELLTEEVPFSFELYRFGPYSFDLDEYLRDLATFGAVSATIVDEGYGPKHEVSAAAKPLLADHPESFSRDQLDLLKRAASAIGNRSSGDLELIATCLWVEREENIVDRDEVIARVKIIKPRYDIETIANQYDSLQSLKLALQ